MGVSCFSSAADWKLDEPAWSGRMKITAKDKMAYIKLEDRNTGEQTVTSACSACVSVYITHHMNSLSLN